MPLCTVLGSSLILVAAGYNQDLPQSYYFPMIYLGLFINGFSVAFPVLAIRCPRCGSRWLATALRKPLDIWYRSMMQLPRCPVCGFPSHGHTRGSVRLRPWVMRAGPIYLMNLLYCTPVLGRLLARRRYFWGWVRSRRIALSMITRQRVSRTRPACAPNALGQAMLGAQRAADRTDFLEAPH